MQKDIKTQVNDILVTNGLDFTINKLPLMGIIGAGEDRKEYPTPYFGLMNSKTNEIINTVKVGYHVSQNDEIVEMVLRGMEKFGTELSVTKAGSLNGGKKVFLQLGIEGNGIVGGDTIKRYVTIIDSNDGSTGLSIGIGDLTMSCSNQFFKFYKKGEAKFRHTATLEAKIKTIPYLIEMALAESLKQIEVYNKFQSTPITQKLVNDLVNHLLECDRSMTSTELAALATRSKNQMEGMYNHITKEMNGKGVNLWGLHSGITSWTTHERKAPKRDNGLEESLMVGSSYAYSQKSLEFCLAQ